MARVDTLPQASSHEHLSCRKSAYILCTLILHWPFVSMPQIGAPVLQECLRGYNGTILAYGQLLAASLRTMNRIGS